MLRISLGLILLAVAASCGVAASQAGYPQSIGAVSDYGNVLDHSGRVELAQRAEDIQTSLGIDVYILVTWESPTPRVDELAVGIMTFWGIASERSLLVVFLRDDVGEWSVSVQVGAGIQQSAQDLRRGVMETVQTAVANGRIREAMVAMFEYLDGGHLVSVSGSPSRVGQLLRLVTVCLGLAAAAWVAWRRVCPRCGRFLRKESTRRALHHGGPGLGARSSTVYLCAKCGYQRSGERARRSRRGRRPL